MSKGPAGLNYEGIRVPAFLTFPVRIICWLGLPWTLYGRTEENKQDVHNIGMTECLRFTTNCSIYL